MNRLRRYALPYLVWMGVFILIPTVVLLLLAFSDLSLYRPGVFRLSLANFTVFSLPTTQRAIWNSFRFAGIAAAI